MLRRARVVRLHPVWHMYEKAQRVDRMPTAEAIDGRAPWCMAAQGHCENQRKLMQDIDKPLSESNYYNDDDAFDTWFGDRA